jgi:hypothetical protein
MLYDSPSPEVTPLPDADGSARFLDRPLTPIPSSANRPVVTSSSSLTPLICDERAISSLLGNLLDGSGLTISSAARKLGINSASLRQYINGRRGRPSLLWFLRFAAICGAKVTIEFPTHGR